MVAQLNLTEKGLRKMMEMSKSYRHALLNADVLDTFKVPSLFARPCIQDIAQRKSHTTAAIPVAVTCCLPVSVSSFLPP